MSGEITVGIRLKADGSGFVGAVKLSRAEMEKFARAEGKAAGKAAELNQRTKGLAGSFGTLRRLLLAGVVAGTIREFIKLADISKLLNSRLAIVTRSSAELTKVQAKLFEISQRTRTSFEATTELFTRVARGQKELGASTDDLLKFTENIQKLVIVSGASAEESKNAIIQLSQGLASGTLRGQDLRSVLEQLPAVARAIADSLGVGIGKFRQLANEGKITAKAVVDGILSQTAKIDKNFARIKTTVGQSTTVARNSLLRLVGVLDKATGASKGTAKGITGISSALDSLTRLINANKGSLKLFFGADFATPLDKVNAQISQIDERLAKGAFRRYGQDIAHTGVRLKALRSDLAAFRSVLFRRELRLPQQKSRGKPKPAPGASGKTSSALKLTTALELMEKAQLRLNLARTLGIQTVKEAALQNKILAVTARAGIKTGSDQFRTVDRLIRSITGLKEANDAAVAAAKRDKAVRKEVTGKLREMRDGYVAATVAAKKWRIEALAGLDATRPGYDAFAAQIDEVYNKMLADAYDRALENSRRWEAGVIRGLRNYAREATDGARQAEDAIVGSLDEAKRVFVDFAATGKLEFGSLVDFIKRKAAEIIFDQTIGGFLKSIIPQAGAVLSRLLGGGASAGETALLAHARANVGQFHSGGLVGAGGARRPVHPAAFGQAQRFATGGFPGLGAGEVPAILHKQEGVFTPQQMNNTSALIRELATLAARPAAGGGGGDKIEIIDQRGAGAPGLQTSQRPDPARLGRMITTIVIPELGREISRGALDKPIASRFGLRPTPQGG